MLDLCCGTGALGAGDGGPRRPGCELHAADVDPAAVRCAERNLDRSAAGSTPATSTDPLPAALRGRVDVIVANAPYVPTEAIALMPPEARDHEPRLALDGGPDGVDVHRRVAAGAPGWLAPGGSLLIETGRRQAARTAAAVSRGRPRPLVVSSGEAMCTVVVATLPETAPRVV